MSLSSSPNLPIDQLLKIYDKIPDVQKKKTSKGSKETRVFLKAIENDETNKSDKAIKNDKVAFEKRGIFSKLRIFIKGQSKQYDFQVNALKLKNLFEKALTTKDIKGDELQKLGDFADYYQKMVSDYAEKHVKKHCKKDDREAEKKKILKNLSLNFKPLAAQIIYSETNIDSQDVKKCLLNHIDSLVSGLGKQDLTINIFIGFRALLQKAGTIINQEATKFNKSVDELQKSIKSLPDESSKNKYTEKLKEARETITKYTTKNPNAFLENLKAKIDEAFHKIDEIKKEIETYQLNRSDEIKHRNEDFLNKKKLIDDSKNELFLKINEMKILSERLSTLKSEQIQGESINTELNSLRLNMSLLENLSSAITSLKTSNSEELDKAKNELESLGKEFENVSSLIKKSENNIHSLLLEMDKELQKKFEEENKRSGLALPAGIQSVSAEQLHTVKGMEGVFLDQISQKEKIFTSYQELSSAVTQLKQYGHEIKPEAQQEASSLLLRLIPNSFDELETRREDLKEAINQIDTNLDSESLSSEAERIMSEMSGLNGFDGALYRQKIKEIRSTKENVQLKGFTETVKALKIQRTGLKNAIEDAQSAVASWKKGKFSEEQKSLDLSVQSQMKKAQDLVEDLKKQEFRGNILGVDNTRTEALQKEVKSLEAQFTNIQSLISTSDDSSIDSSIKTLTDEYEQIKQNLDRLESEKNSFDEELKKNEEQTRGLLQKRDEEVDARSIRIGLEIEKRENNPKDCPIETLPDFQRSIASKESSCSDREREIHQVREGIKRLEGNISAISENLKGIFSSEEILANAKKELSQLAKDLESSQELKNFSNLQSRVDDAQKQLAPHVLTQKIKDNETRLQTANALKDEIQEGFKENEKSLKFLQNMAKKLGIDDQTAEECEKLFQEFTHTFTQSRSPEKLADLQQFEEKVKDVRNIFDALNNKLEALKNIVHSTLLREEREISQEIADMSSRLAIANPSINERPLSTRIESEEKAFSRIQELKVTKERLKSIEEKFSQLQAISQSYDEISAKKEAASILVKSMPRSNSNSEVIETYLAKSIDSLNTITDTRDVLRESEDAIQEAQSLPGFSPLELIENLKEEIEALTIFRPIEAEDPQAILQEIETQRSKVFHAIQSLKEAVQNRKNDISLEKQYVLNSVQSNEAALERGNESIRDLAVKLQHLEKINEPTIQNGVKQAHNLIKEAEEQIKLLRDQITEAKEDICAEKGEHLDSLKKKAADVQSKETDLQNKIAQLAQVLSNIESFFRENSNKKLFELDEALKKVGFSLSIPPRYLSDEYSVEEFSQVFETIIRLHKALASRQSEISSIIESLGAFIKNVDAFSSDNVIVTAILKDAKAKSESLLEQLSLPEKLKEFSKLIEEYQRLTSDYSNEAMMSRHLSYQDRLEQSQQKAQSALTIADGFLQRSNSWKSELTPQQWLAVVAYNEACKSLAAAQKTQIKLPQSNSVKTFEQGIQDQISSFENSISSQLAIVETLSQEVQRYIEDAREQKRVEKESLLESISACLTQLKSNPAEGFEAFLNEFPADFEGNEKDWSEGIEKLKQYANHLENEVRKTNAHNEELKRAENELNSAIQEFKKWKKLAIKNDPSGTIQEFLSSVGNIEGRYKRKLQSSSNPKVVQWCKKKISEIKSQAQEQLQNQEEFRKALLLQHNTLNEVSSQLQEAQGAYSLLTDVFGMTQLLSLKEDLDSAISSLRQELEKEIEESAKTPLSKLQSLHSLNETKISTCRIQLETFTMVLHGAIQEEREVLNKVFTDLEQKASDWSIDLSQEKEIVQAFQQSSPAGFEGLYEPLKELQKSIQATSERVDKLNTRLSGFREILRESLSHRLQDLDEKIKNADAKTYPWNYVELTLNRHRTVVLNSLESQKLKDKAMGSGTLESFTGELKAQIEKQEKTTSDLVRRAQKAFEEITALRNQHKEFALKNQDSLQGIATSLDMPLIQLESRLSDKLNEVVRNYADTQTNKYNILGREIKGVEEELNTLRNIQKSQEIYIGALSKLSVLSNLAWPEKFKPFVDMRDEAIRKKAMELFEQQHIQNEEQLLTIWIVDILKGIGNVNNYSVDDLSRIRSFMKEFFMQPQYQNLLAVDIYAPSSSLENISVVQPEGETIAMKMDEAFDIMCAQTIIDRLRHAKTLKYEEPKKLQEMASDIQKACQEKKRTLKWSGELIERIINEKIEDLGEEMLQDDN